jgi:glycosyltransferase involved in cell wall biosynthesis
MRILQLAPVWETVPPPAYGGTEAVVSALTEELVRRGHDVTLWASGDSTTSARHRYVVPRSLRLAGLTQDALQYGLLHVASALATAGDFDIVHNHNGPPSELAMAMSLAFPEIPMLTTLHCQPTEETREVWTNYQAWYNAISHQQAATLPEFPMGHFAGVVHNSIDVDSFPFRERKDGYLLSIGRITPEKAPHLAIEVARRAGMKILIAGKMSTDAEQHYFDEEVSPLLDGTTAEFIGEADAGLKRRLYAGANCLLMPLCWEEPFGLVMVEAMACGTPVIAFRRGAAPEIIKNGDNGFLVEGLDEMVDATKGLAHIDPAACRRSVEVRFSPRALADKYLAVYEEILDSAVGLPSPMPRLLPKNLPSNRDDTLPAVGAMGL